jgi:hypothetical protein
MIGSTGLWSRHVVGKVKCNVDVINFVFDQIIFNIGICIRNDQEQFITTKAQVKNSDLMALED